MTDDLLYSHANVCTHCLKLKLEMQKKGLWNTETGKFHQKVWT